MTHLEIPIEANDASWRVRCNERIERLKNTHFSSSDTSPRVTSRLLQEKLSAEKKFMSLELYQSVKNKNADEFVGQLEKIVVERRLSLSEIFDQVMRAGDSLLHVAVRFGADDIAELICIHSTELLVKRDINGNTALHIAAREKNCNVIKLILSQNIAEKEKSLGEGNAEISSENEGNELTGLRNENGDTPLHEAVYSDDNFEAVSLLLEADKSIAHHLNNSGESPLYIAVQASKCTKVIDLLLEASFVDNSLPSGNGVSPLHATISERDSALLIHILEKKVEVMYLRDEDGGTPLHYAASTGYLEGVRELLYRSTQLALEWDKKGHLPIHLACEMGHVKVVEEFLKQKWPNVSDMLTSQGQNIFHIAVKNGQRNVVKYLLSDENRVDKYVINGKDKMGNTALHMASMRFDGRILRLLSRDDRVDLNIKNNHDLTAEDIFQWEIRTFSRLPEFALFLFFRNRRKPNESAKAPIPKEWTENELDTAILVAVLIAAVTFAAGFTVPGSVYDSDKPGSEFGGLAVLGHRAMFKMFMICNTIAMYTSTLGCVYLAGAQFAADPEGEYVLLANPKLEVQQILVGVGLLAVGLALLTMPVAFMAAVRLVARNISWLANLVTIIAALFICFVGLAHIISIQMFTDRNPLWRLVFSPLWQFLWRLFCRLVVGKKHV